MKLGKVQSLWRYPVKSLMGEGLNQIQINTRGVLGDRMFAISNTQGKFGSGKDTRRFRRIDGLFNLSANTTKTGISITFEDSVCLLDTDKQINEKLSQSLHQSVSLTKEQNIAHFDDGPIHILTTGSLAKLQSLLPNSKIDSKRFRANIILDSECLDDELLGKTIQINDTLLEITHQTQRCRMIAIEQQSLTHRPDILKVIAQHFDMKLGVYAKVIRIGSINIDDTFEIIKRASPCNTING